jgi:hypothetical protein
MRGGGIKHFPGTVVVGPHGQAVFTRGYTEIGNIRVYHDQVIIGPHGELVIDKGGAEVLPERR